MNTHYRRIPLALLALLALSTACIGDPSGLDFCEGDRCEANENDHNENNENQTTDPDPLCVVPTSRATIADALNARCTEIEIAAGQSVHAIDDSSLPPLFIDSAITIIGGGEGAAIEVPMEGLFSIVGGGALRLENIEIIGTNENISAPLIAVSGNSSLTAIDVVIEDIYVESSPLIAISGGSTVHFEGSSIEDITSLGDNSIVACTGSTFTLGASAIAANTVLVEFSQLSADLDIRGGAVTLENGCHLELSDSLIVDNRVELKISNFASAPPAYEVQIGGAAISSRNSTVEILDGSQISQNSIDVDANNSGVATTLVLRATGAGVDLHDSTLLLRQSSIDDNSIDLHLLGDTFLTGSHFQASGGGISLRGSGQEDPLIDSSTLSNNQIAMNVRDSSLDSLAFGAGVAFQSHDPDFPQLQMVNSTISTNMISGARRSYGAGISIEADFEENQFVALLRYSTIANNLIGDTNTENAAGFFILLPPSAVTIPGASGPWVSLIGILMNDNRRGDIVDDCGGLASSTPLELKNAGRTPRTTGFNIFSATTNPDPCRNWAVDGDADSPFLFERYDAGLSELRDNGGPTLTQLPGLQSLVHFYGGGPYAEYGELVQRQCTGIDAYLATDQRGQTRPGQAFDLNREVFCVPGSVELQESEN